MQLDTQEENTVVAEAHSLAIVGRCRHHDHAHPIAKWRLAVSSVLMHLNPGTPVRICSVLAMQYTPCSEVTLTRFSQNLCGARCHTGSITERSKLYNGLNT